MRVVVLSVVLATALSLAVTGLVAFAAVKFSVGSVGPVDLIVSAPGSSSALKPADSTALSQQLNGIAAVSPIVSGIETVGVANQSASVRVEGVIAEYPRMLTWQMDQGRFLTQDDDAALDRVAVVDSGLAATLFGRGNAALGGTLRIRNIPFTIVGLGSDTRAQPEVLIPFRTGQIRLFGPTALNQIVLQVDSSSQASSVSRQVERVLRARHGLRNGQLDDFSISSVAAEMTPSAERVVTVVQQFWCQAKNICASHGG